MKMLFTGGGSLGPVTPLLAVVEAMRTIDSTVAYVWVGTPHGPERQLVEAAGVTFFSLEAPKLSRNAPRTWPAVPFRLLWSFRMAVHILTRERPDIVVSAGAYVSVPVVWAAAALGIPSWIHQQDVRPGLANRLMAPFAKQISVAWARDASAFAKKKTIVVGNPVRPSVLGGSRERGLQRFGLAPTRPTVLVLGGGTGAVWLNHAVTELARAHGRMINILHLTGIGKKLKLDEVPEGYVAIELVKEGMADAYAMADLVVCRAGMGTISELAATKKAAIVIPMPNSHQEDNTAVLEELHAAVVLHQERTTPQILNETIARLLKDPAERAHLGERLHAALPTDGVAEKLAGRLRKTAEAK